MSDTDAADLFAIPDFWQCSSWQQQPPLAAKDRQDGFFNLEINNGDKVTFFLGNDDQPSGNQEQEDVFFKIPALLSQLQSSSSSQRTDTTQQPISTDEHATSSISGLEDIWLSLDENLAPQRLPAFRTWASFEQADIANCTALFATEQGPELLDALVAAGGNPLRLIGPPQYDGEEHANDILDTREYCACLLALALGRSSVLFAWNDSKRHFHPTLERARISGFTADVLRSVEAAFLDCGKNSRFLRAFVDHTYSSAAHANTPSRVALARSVDGILLTLQRELGTRGQGTRSLLQLQALVQPTASLAKFIRDLVTKLSRTTMSEEASDEKFLTVLFQEAQSMEYNVVFMRDIIKQILQLTSEPWLSFVREWIGLDPRSKFTMWAGEYRSKGFVRLDDRIWIDDMGMELAEPDYFLDEAKMPAFVPEEMAKSLFETGRNLRFLWTNHPEHPLSDPVTFALAGPPLLQWRFDWESIHALESEALAYEQSIQQSIATPGQNGIVIASTRPKLPQQPQHLQDLPFSPKVQEIERPTPYAEFQVYGQDEAQIEQNIKASIARLDDPLNGPKEDDLAAILRRQLFDGARDDDSNMAALGDFAPHWSLLPLLSFGPVISAQARLTSRACMKLLFGVHAIREHLQLLRQFQLLGNGIFCSRLSHALFDPELAVAEQRTGIELSSGGLGLRLSDRRTENWPPASSELRLALMGVLTESYSRESGGIIKVPGVATMQELPGSLSFAVRDLSLEEMDKCMDPDSLEALDFLRLSYKPPSALTSVITPAILSKYDRIFKLLLRVLRMYYVVNQLQRDTSHSYSRLTSGINRDSISTRFRNAARHFVSNIMAYFLDTGVAMPWQKFDHWLDNVQCTLEGNDQRSPHPLDSRSEQNSPERLRERHEQAVDEIMLALLLRKRQQPLLQLLEAIFGLILEFAKSSREQQAHIASADQNKDAKEEARRTHQANSKKLYASFRKKVAAFLAVCRGLSEKEADSVARKDYQQQQQYQDGSRAGEGSSLSILILMLDYNGHYTSSR